MIDVNLVKTEFDNYANQYDGVHPKVKLKIDHTHRVARIAGEIAKSLGLNQEHINLAIAIGYLHDLGRFEQIKQYNSFNDLLTVDHADYSDEVLFKENLIRRFIPDDKYDNIIEPAIKNHNKKHIDESVSGVALVHAKIIRDADKADIMWVYCNESLDTIFKMNELPTDNHVSDLVYEQFMEHHFIDKENMHTSGDLIVLTAGFIFDSHTKYFLHYIKTHKLLDLILDGLSVKDIKTATQKACITSEINSFLATA